jgi:hypothetical protein
MLFRNKQNKKTPLDSWGLNNGLLKAKRWQISYI